MNLFWKWVSTLHTTKNDEEDVELKLMEMRMMSVQRSKSSHGGCGLCVCVLSEEAL